MILTNAMPGSVVSAKWQSLRIFRDRMFRLPGFAGPGSDPRQCSERQGDLPPALRRLTSRM